MNFREMLENTQLNEMPRIFINKLNTRYIEKYLIKPLEDSIKDKSIFDTGIKIDGKHLVSVPVSKFDNIYAVGDKDGFIGATRVNIFNTLGKNKASYYKVQITKKIRDGFKGFIEQVYLEISKDLDTFLFTDNIQSVSSSSVWKKLFTSGKCQVKVLKDNIEVFNLKIEDIWGMGLEKENIIVGIKYK